MILAPQVGVDGELACHAGWRPGRRWRHLRQEYPRCPKSLVFVSVLWMTSPTPSALPPGRESLAKISRPLRSHRQNAKSGKCLVKQIFIDAAASRDKRIPVVSDGVMTDDTEDSFMTACLCCPANFFKPIVWQNIFLLFYDQLIRSFRKTPRISYHDDQDRRLLHISFNP